MRIAKSIAAAFLMSAAAFAGQSIVAGPHAITSATVPNTPTNRVEFYIHDWATTGPIHILASGATGWFVATIPFSSTNVLLLIYNSWESNPQLAQFQIGNLTQTALMCAASTIPPTRSTSSRRGTAPARES